MKNVRVSSNVQEQPPAFVPPSARTTVAPSSNLSYVAVMPEQFFSLPQYSDRGEAALMYAVLEDALICFAKQFVENGLRAQGLAKEAERWFFSNDDRWPFSFINICLVLRMNPEYVRLGLHQWRQRRPTQIKRKKRHVVCRTRSLRVAA